MSITQRSFGAGELAPAFHARADHERYATGLKTCRNFYIRKSGGAISRPGTKYIGESRHNTKDVRLIPWIFSESQAYVIEIGDQLIRIIDSTTQDYLFTATQAITAITKANPGVLTVTAHGLATDDVVKIEDVGGMTELNDRFMRVVYIGANTFSLKEMDGTAVNTTSYTTYTSGGTVKEPFSIAAANSVVPDTVPWLEAELPYITFAQSGDVMTLCHTTYAPRDLVRFDGGVTPISWRLLTKSFGTSLATPAEPTLPDEAKSNGYIAHSLLVTAVADSGDESLRSTVTGYGYTQGEQAAICADQTPAAISGSGTAYGVTLNGTLTTASAFSVEYGAYITITSTTDDDWSAVDVQIKGVSHDGSAGSETIKGPQAFGRVSFANPYKAITDIVFDALGVAGSGTGAGTNKIQVGVDTLEIFPLNIQAADASAVDDTVTRYRAYRADISNKILTSYAYGFVAESDDRQGLFDEGGTPDYSRPPPEAMLASNGGALFTSASNYPAVVGYYQQRLLLARTANQPETIWMSRPGLYYVANSLGGKSGSNMSLTDAAGTTTLVETGSPFATSDVGLYIHVWGCNKAGNNGRFAILTRSDANTITYANASGATADPNPDTTANWKIIPEYFANFNVTYPQRDDNAVRFAIASLQLDRPRHVLDLGRLIIFTDSGEWIIEGDSAGVITPTQINPRKISYCGSDYLRPLVVQNTALFVQGNRKTVRDLVYEQQSTGYQGNDLTVFSQHLFEGVTITDWTYQQDPDSLLWMVLSDGDMLSMSYLKDFNMYGWAHHDTPGTSSGFVSVCSVPDGSGKDDVYVAVKRTINGRVFRSIEVMSDRFDTTDSHLVQSDATVIVDNSAATGRQAMWLFDEAAATTRATDSSGNGYHGLPTGDPTVQTGKIDGARGVGRPNNDPVRLFQLDGYNSGGALGGTGYEGSLDFDPVTWAGWVYISSGAAENTKVANHFQFDGSGETWAIEFDASGSLHKLSIKLGFDDDPTYTQETLKSSAFDIAEETWHHIGFTWNGTWFRIYLNGVEVNASNANAGKGLWFSSTWAYWPTIGAHWGGTGPSLKFFNGYVDHWEVYNVAKSQEWFRGAAAKISGLWHMEGESVSVLGDGAIIASPNNSAYTAVTVSNGTVTLPSVYDYTIIGLSVVNDLETLDLDPPSSPYRDTMAVHGEQKLTTRVAMALNRSSRCWVGAADPGTDGALTNLDELDIHAEAGGTSQTSGSVTLASAVVDQQIRGDWNSNGRVFVRNVDPIPLNVLSISPATLAGPRGGGRRR